MKTSILLGVVAALTLTAPTYADPPDHAPAHGKRAKDRGEHPGKGNKHRGYSGVEWVEDYGVLAGRCNTEAVMTAVGATAGAVIGNRVASDGNRTVATIVGAIIGGVVGNRVGDAMDDRDRACIGHSLELAPIGRSVTWTNPASNVVVVVKPLRDLQDGCRLFEYRVDGRPSREPLVACRSGAGVWAIRS
jgi:surface antigen